MSDNALFFVHALTGLHPGGGSALGVIDLPIQRERHTDWPIIAGSSLKGVLRATCYGQFNGADSEVLAAFGPETKNAADHAGAIAVTDARILAFPVRSLTGVFAWVTCPAVLDRLSRDLTILGSPPLKTSGPHDRDNAICNSESPLIASEGKIILEEFEFSVDSGDMTVADWIADHAVKDNATRRRLRKHLVVLHDDAFTHFVRNATEVVARIGLNYEQKTVRKGALFYEEYLPAETLMYALIICQDSRLASCKMTAGEVLHWLKARDIETLQIGGGETTGKGFWCAVERRFFSCGCESRLVTVAPAGSGQSGLWR